MNVQDLLTILSRLPKDAEIKIPNPSNSSRDAEGYVSVLTIFEDIFSHAWILSNEPSPW